MNYITWAQDKHTINNKTIQQTKKIIFFFGPGDPLATVRHPQKSLSSQSLGKY